MKLSGSVTVLILAVVGRSSGLAAQATGTMQVVATVTTGGPAWAGLTQAQGMARQIGATGTIVEPRRVDASLARVELRPPRVVGASTPPAIEIHYLRN